MGVGGWGGAQHYRRSCLGWRQPLSAGPGRRRGERGGRRLRTSDAGIMAVRQLLQRRAAAARWRRGYSSAGAAEYLHRSIVPTMHYQKSLPRYGGTPPRSPVRPPGPLPSGTVRPAARARPGASVTAGPGAAAEDGRRAGLRGDAGRGRWRRRPAALRSRRPGVFAVRRGERKCIVCRVPPPPPFLCSRVPSVRGLAEGKVGNTQC